MPIIVFYFVYQNIRKAVFFLSELLSIKMERAIGAARTYEERDYHVLLTHNFE
jgi:hypothetical protein